MKFKTKHNVSLKGIFGFLNKKKRLFLYWTKNNQTKIIIVFFSAFYS